jgi:hypothetical protein
MVYNCHHCKQQCKPVELGEEKLQDVDYHGVACLTDVEQAIYEGMRICIECYEKEGGIT